MYNSTAASSCHSVMHSNKVFAKRREGLKGNRHLTRENQWFHPNHKSKPRSSCVRARRTCGSVGDSNKTTETESGDEFVGVRWNPSYQRWERSQKAEMNIDNYDLSKGDYTIWPIVHTYLTRNGLQSLSPAEAENLLKSKGGKILDVRLTRQFEYAHIVGSISVPMFQTVQGSAGKDILKRLAMAAFFMSATERNPNFVEDVANAVSKDSVVIVACDLGGTLETEIKGRRGGFKDPDRAFGRETRSLKACYELLIAGFEKVYHLKGGVPQWK